MAGLTISARVGANIRRFREQSGISVRQMSELLHEAGLDLSRSGLSRLEHGERPLSVDELVTIADVLDQAPSDLLEQETVITGGGDLRMTLDRHDVEPEPAEPRTIVDPRIMEAIASLAVGAEMRAVMQLLAATTVTPSTMGTLRAIGAAGSAGVEAALEKQIRPLLDAMTRNGQAVRRTPIAGGKDSGSVT